MFSEARLLPKAAIEKRLFMKKNDNEEIRQLKIFKDLAPQQWSRIYPLIIHNDINICE
jgi:hypothetical protein